MKIPHWLVRWATQQTTIHGVGVIVGAVAAATLHKITWGAADSLAAGGLALMVMPEASAGQRSSLEKLLLDGFAALDQRKVSASLLQLMAGDAMAGLSAASSEASETAGRPAQGDLPAQVPAIPTRFHPSTFQSGAAPLQDPTHAHV